MNERSWPCASFLSPMMVIMGAQQQSASEAASSNISFITSHSPTRSSALFLHSFCHTVMAAHLHLRWTGYKNLFVYIRTIYARFSNVRARRLIERIDNSFECHFSCTIHYIWVSRVSLLRVERVRLWKLGRDFYFFYFCFRS